MDCTQCGKALETYADSGSSVIRNFGGSVVRTVTWTKGDPIPCGCQSAARAQLRLLDTRSRADSEASDGIQNPYLANPELW